MRCPNCGCSKLKLGIVFAGEVACTFRDGAIVEILDAASLDSYWSADSACHCINCDWSGRVGDLSQQKQRNVVPEAALRESRLADIEHRVISGQCPKPIRNEVQQLIRMVRQLQRQVQILESVRRAGRRGQRLRGGDTAVL